MGVAQIETIFFYDLSNFLIIVRHFFSTEILKKYRDAFADLSYVSKQPNDRSVAANQVGIASDEFRLNHRWYEIWEACDASLLKATFGEFFNVIYPPQARTVRHSSGFVAWHQDEAYMLALGAKGHSQTITCNVLLEDTSVNKPTLRFVNNPKQRPVEHYVDDGKLINHHKIHEEIEAVGYPMVACETELGDAIFFGNRVLHQTYCDTDDFSARRSMEYRLTPQQSLVSGKDYFDLKTKKFFLKE